MSMALDASHGTVEGVKALTLQAMKAGATKGEIMETLRVAQYVSGVGCVYTAAHAYKDLFWLFTLSIRLKTITCFLLVIFTEANAKMAIRRALGIIAVLISGKNNYFWVIYPKFTRLHYLSPVAPLES
jgi:hypothetical protein